MRKKWRDVMCEQDATPVLLLSGFLGAGKTTTLRHWIQNEDGIKVGCIVNDVASVNIDAKLLRRKRDDSTSTVDLTDTIELENGCACCNLTEELFDAIENLLYLASKRGFRFDLIVLEASGVAEPQNVRDVFRDARLEELPISKMVRLERIVTVVDTKAFEDYYSTREMMVERPDLGEGGGRRPVVDLLVEQVENADVILMNKVDLVSEHKLKGLEDLLTSLNPLCTLVQTSYGNVDLRHILQQKAILPLLDLEGQHRGAVAAAKNRIEPTVENEHCCDQHCNAAGCPGRHKGTQKTSASMKYGIDTFVYVRRTPFHTERLRAVMLEWAPRNGSVPVGKSPLQRVLRSKGFLWLSGSHTNAHYWSHAGQHLEIKDVGCWWDAVDREEWPSSKEAQESILRDFSDEKGIGDRRQELVFIGIGMDEKKIARQLDEALLSDAELAEYHDHWLPSRG